MQGVVAVAALEDVVLAPAVEHVVAAEAGDEVAQARAGDGVRRVGPCMRASPGWTTTPSGVRARQRHGAAAADGRRLTSESVARAAVGVVDARRRRATSRARRGRDRAEAAHAMPATSTSAARSPPCAAPTASVSPSGDAATAPPTPCQGAAGASRARARPGARLAGAAAADPHPRRGIEGGARRALDLHAAQQLRPAGRPPSRRAAGQDNGRQRPLARERQRAPSRAGARGGGRPASGRRARRAAARRPRRRSRPPARPRSPPPGTPRSRVSTANGAAGCVGSGIGAAGTIPRSKAATALPAAAKARRPSQLIATARDGPGSAGRATTRLVVTSSSATSLVPVASSATRAWAHAAPRSATRAAMASVRRTGRGSPLAALSYRSARRRPSAARPRACAGGAAARGRGRRRRSPRARRSRARCRGDSRRTGSRRRALDVGEGGRHAADRRPCAAGAAPACRSSRPPPSAGRRLAARGRVAPAVIVRADLRGGLALAAEQRVDQRRLAHARRADQRAVRPRPSCAVSASTPSPRWALVATTGTPGRRRAGWRATGSGSTTRSVLLRTSTGAQPPAAATATKRSRRRALRSRLAEVTTKATSTLAARSWPARASAPVAGQPGADGAGRVDDDPVADRRASRARPATTARASPGRLRPQAAAMDGDHARGRAAVDVGCREGRGEWLAPAEVFEVQGALQARLTARRSERPSAPRRRAGVCRGGAADRT